MPISSTLVKKREKLLQQLVSCGLFEVLNAYSSVFHYSYGMLYDFLVRDYSELIEGFSRRQICRLLKLWGFKHDNTQYLHLSQATKLRFRYPSHFSVEMIEKEIKIQSTLGAKKCHQIRKTWKNYNPKNHSEYWIKQGLTLSEAEQIASDYRKSKSPHSRYFSKYAGLSDEEVSEKISEYALIRGLAGLEAQSYCASQIEKRLHRALSKSGYQWMSQKLLRTTDAERNNDKLQRVYVYDVYIPSKNLLIECNGTYWHADPRVYCANDQIKYPGKLLTAQERWQIDEKKSNFAKSRGYVIKYLWELDSESDNHMAAFMKEIECLNS